MSIPQITIDKSISKYIVFDQENLRDALQKINSNEERIIFAVSPSGILTGVLTDGDFRRWVLAQGAVDLKCPVSQASNTSFLHACIDDDHKKIAGMLQGNIEFVPILDRSKRLVAIARRREPKIQIGNRVVDDRSPSFLIAEIGNNHNGDFDLGRRLIDLARESGADCAKFQLRDVKSLYRNSGNPNDSREDLGSQYTLDLLSRFQLPVEQMYRLFDYCKEVGLIPLCTPWDLASLKALEDYELDAYKVASADLTNHELLEALAKTHVPLICSTGMSTDFEIEESVELLKKLGAPYALLHCNSTYPTPFKDVNLSYMSRLKEVGQCPIGYSGHERGYSVPLAAVAMGAKIIEKHFTVDRNMEGNDHKVSLLPEEFQRMVQGIREIEESFGTSTVRKISQGELINREVLGKSLVINRDLNPGEVITQEMIEVKSPGQGLRPYKKQNLIGLTAKRKFRAGDFFFPSDLSAAEGSLHQFRFERPWGLPVRYHDFRQLADKVSMDLVEFHLSYKDLDARLEDFFDGTSELQMVVHSPELFAHDHILDLCSTDENYRMRSLAELQRVIRVTRDLKKYFPKTERPRIVVNAGGFTLDAPMVPSARAAAYAKILQSCQQLDCQGIELIFQTMPPFPWHYGGQRYQNLFIDPDEAQEFCIKNGFRICLDISHSKLACNHFGWSFREFVQKVGPHVAHLHIADAEGVDGEGLQVGDGDIDFSALAADLKASAPNASFIPEIWQGHKNQGEGFWVALERLENWF